MVNRAVLERAIVSCVALSGVAAALTSCSRVCGDPHPEWREAGGALTPVGVGGGDSGLGGGSGGGGSEPEGGSGGIPPTGAGGTDPMPLPAVRCDEVTSPSIIDFSNGSTSPWGRFACDSGCDPASESTDGNYTVSGPAPRLSFTFGSACADASAFSGVQFLFGFDATFTEARFGVSTLDPGAEPLDAGSCAPDAGCSGASVDFLPDLVVSNVTVRIPFASLVGPAGEAADSARLVQLSWEFESQFGIYVNLDDIAFYVEGSDDAAAPAADAGAD